MAGKDKENKDAKGNNPNKKGSGDNSKIHNKDTSISKKTRDLGKYAKGNKKEKKDKEKKESINDMGGKGRDRSNIQRENEQDKKTRGTREDNDRSDRRRKKREDTKKRQHENEINKREEEAKQQKIDNLRKRRQAVQRYLHIAKTSENPLSEIDWGDKNLKSKDRRKIRNVLESRGIDDKDIYTSEKKALNKRIKENNKESAKAGAGLAGNVTALAGTGGVSAVLGLPSIILGVLKIRRNRKDNKQIKRSMRWRRLFLLLPTILIVFGLMIAGWLLLVTGSQFIGTMLSHPEAIRELYEAGALGDALYIGNVTEDVMVDGEVVVKGNPNAQPGCFVYNGVWYCGGCLSTGGVEASSNIEIGGSGTVTGELAEPMKSPYRVTSNFGMRWGRLHRGIDLVGMDGELGVYASDGGKVTVAKGVCSPGSGYYPNNDPTCGGWGNYVEIEHNGMPYRKTLYAHLDYVHVEEGDLVDKGQQLGIMGHTGNSTGAHLHFEVYEGDNYGSQVNPRTFIPSFPASGQVK